MINYRLKSKVNHKHIMNFVFSHKVENYFAKVLGHLIIIECFQLNDYVYMNSFIHSVLRCLGFTGMTMTKLIGLIHYMLILIHCHAFQVAKNFVHQLDVQIGIKHFYTVYLIVCFS